MGTLNLLYKPEFKINDNIKIVIPTVDEVISNEDEYYGLISLLTAMPIDLMVQLDDLGIDFTTINEYELFLLLFNSIKSQDTHLVFGNLDLNKFELAAEEQSGMMVLIDRENDIKIDKLIQTRIADTLRQIHHIKKDRRKPGNDEAKDYLIERARAKMKKNKKRNTRSQLESLIVAMVNTEQFKYNFETVKSLSIYQFNESVQQIIKKVDYDNRMHGVYFGTVDPKKMSQDDLNWLVHK